MNWEDQAKGNCPQKGRYYPRGLIVRLRERGLGRCRREFPDKTKDGTIDAIVRTNG